MNDANELIPCDAEHPFDHVLRAELRWEVPPELTNRLMELVANTATVSHLSVAETPEVPTQPRSWYAVLALVLTSMVVGLSFAIAWQVYGQLGTQLGLTPIWEQIRQMPDLGLLWLYDELPFMRYVIAGLNGIRDQLHWLLLALILWLALDGWSPDMSLHRQPSS